MNSRQEIMDELKELECSLPHTAYPAAAPDGYFNKLPQNIMDTIAAEAPMFITGISKATFTVPEGYFESFADRVLALATDNAADALPRTKAPFTVPEKYFEELPTVALQKIKATIPKEQPAQQVYILPFWKKLSVAAAAVVFFFIGLAAFHTNMKDGRISAGASQKLAQLPVETINEYVAQNIDDFESDEIISLSTGYPSASVINKHVNRKDIEDYLQENTLD